MFTGNTLCNTFVQGLLSGTFNLSSTTTQVYKCALYTDAATLDATTPSYTTLNETSGTGYTAGGTVLTLSTPVTNGGSGSVYYFSFNNAEWPASSITARGALIYLANGTTNPAVMVLDFGANKTSVGTTFTVQFPPATSTTAISRFEFLPS